MHNKTVNFFFSNQRYVLPEPILNVQHSFVLYDIYFTLYIFYNLSIFLVQLLMFLVFSLSLSLSLFVAYVMSQPLHAILFSSL